MLTVRPVEAADIPKLEAPLREFYSQTQWYERGLELDWPHVAATIETIVAQGVGCAYLAEYNGEVVGATASIIYPNWMNPKHTTGQEMFWYVKPEFRRTRAGKKLFNALEQGAKEKGADSFSMVALSHLHENRVGKMYEHKGYTPMERVYLKEL